MHTNKQRNGQISIDKIKQIIHSNRLMIAVIGGALLLSAIFCVAMIPSKSILTKKEAQSILDDAVNQTLDLMEDENIFYDLLSENLSVTVLSIDRSGDAYEANCAITSVDCADILIDYLSNIPADELALGNDIIMRLEAAIKTAPIVQKEFVVMFEKTDDGYSPVFTEEIVNYCSGNMQKLKAYLIQFMEKETLQ